MSSQGSRALAALAVAASLACAPAPVAVPVHRQAERSLMAGGEIVRYLLYTPVGYSRGRERFPLILFLHGNGERGDDLRLVKSEGLPRILDGRERFPFLVASPQCPKGRSWSTALLLDFLDALGRELDVDPERVSLTGLSGGAEAALALAVRAPERFAAVAAVAVPSIPEEVCRLRAVPVWIFHNRRDTRLSIRTPRRLAELLTSCGGEARLTIFPVEGHDSWSAAYGSQELYEWLLSRRRVGS